MSTLPTPSLNQPRNTSSGKPACYKPVEQALDQALHGPVHRFLNWTGKRIRAAMVNESYRAAGGSGDAPPQIAEAIELLHAGSLIIDDIEDDSHVRRGRATLHREVGLPIALNAGNWLYFQSLQRLEEAPLPTEITQAMLSRSLQTICRCHEGQALDLGSSVNSISVDGIFPIASEISRLKTGGLTALSAWLGATAAGADAVTRKALSRFGMAAGVCLQMKNDLQELRSFVDGDPRCDDLRNARVTWAWAWASRMASEAKMISMQKRLAGASGDVEELRLVARLLLGLVGSHGDKYVEGKLQRSLRLLGEHVDSTQRLRSTLQRLQSSR